MRLTLRTLLAYVDDQLNPSEAKEIGTKLQEAPAARQLAERIKEVIRRRRLGVPGDPAAGGDGQAAAAGAVLDPNETAAYLDNALPPERVLAVEQVCLADDAHLAEVAAGHQILTQVLSEPAAVPPGLAARLVGLAPAAEHGEAAARPPRPAHQSMPRLAATPAPAGRPADAGFDASLPEHLRRATRRGWGWLPYAAAAALLIGWVGLLAMDGDLFGGLAGGGDAVDPNASGLAPAAVVAGEAAREAEAAAEEEAEAEAARVAAADEAEAARLADTLPVDPAPPEAVSPEAGALEVGGPEAGASGEPGAPDAGMPAGEAVASAASDGPAADAPAEAGADAEPAAPAAPPAAALTLEAGRGLFAFDRDRGGFFAVEEGAAVPVGTPLVVPDPLRATLAAAGVPVRIELLGGTRAVFAPARTVTPAGAAAVSLAVVDGRVLLTRTGPGSDEPGGDGTVAVSAGGAEWLLTPEPGATAAVAVEPRRPRGAGADLAGSPGRAAAAAVGGAVAAVDLAPGSSGETVELSAGTTAALVTDAGRLAAPGAAAGAAAGLFAGGVPGWAGGAAPSEADRLLADQFAAALAPGQPLEFALPALVEDPREIPARQAAAALALVGRAGDLARTLKVTPHPSVVTVAADGLRALLGRSPEGDADVNAALDREFPPEARVALGRLLDRLSDAEARDPEVSAEVVDALDSPELAVRTLAIAELERLTGVTKNYRPLDSPSQRQSAAKRWRRELDQTGALLDPDGAPADDTPPDAADPTGIDFGAVIPEDL